MLPSPHPRRRASVAWAGPCPQCGYVIEADLPALAAAPAAPERGLREAARDYLAHDGSGIKRTDEWAGDFDAGKLMDARDRLRAALAASDAGSVPASAHKPGDHHDYRIECELCGQRGEVQLSIEPQRFAAERQAEQP